MTDEASKAEFDAAASKAVAAMADHLDDLISSEGFAGMHVIVGEDGNLRFKPLTAREMHD